MACGTPCEQNLTGSVFPNAGVSSKRVFGHEDPSFPDVI